MKRSAMNGNGYRRMNRGRARFVPRGRGLRVIIGMPVSVLAMKSLERQLNGVMSDPASVGLAAAVLLGGAMLALIAPVRRATMIDPNAALREE